MNSSCTCACLLVIALVGEHYPYQLNGQESLPLSIPTLEVTVEQAGRRAVDAAERIRDPILQLQIAPLVLYSVKSIPLEVETLRLQLEENTALPQRLGTIAESLAAADPELLLKLSGELEAGSTKDCCLRLLVQKNASSETLDIRQIIREIERPDDRASALLAFAARGRVDFEQCKVCLNEALQLGSSYHLNRKPFIVSESIGRFAAKHFEEISQYVRSELSPNEGVAAFCQMSRIARYIHKQPAVADKLLVEAANLLPTCSDPSLAAEVLRHHYVMIDRKGALELFNNYLLPGIEHKHRGSQLVASLAPGGLDLVVDRAQAVAARFGVPREDVVAASLGNAISHVGPEAVLDWLRSSPVSPTSDRAVGEIARALRFYGANRDVDHDTVQGWVNLLTNRMLTISDRKVRGDSCEAIYLLTRRSQGSQILLSKEFREAYAEARPEVIESANRIPRPYALFGLLSADVQENEIRRQWQAGKSRTAAALVRQSPSLTRAAKRKWYGSLVEQARTVPELRPRAATLSGLGICLKDVDPAESLRVLWEALRIAQQLKLKPEYHDLYDSLGTTFPLATADEALGSQFADFTNGDEEAAQALWSFAATLEIVDEREAVLEALAGLLMKKREDDRAAGVAGSITDSVRSARAWSKVVNSRGEGRVN